MANAPTHTPMLTVEEARDRILGAITPIGSERVALSVADGRILAEPVVAGFDIPAHDNSAMDGYAVRAADVADAAPGTPVVLDVVETVPAGHLATRAVEPGTSIRIMTGALVPAGADAVVIVEVTESEGDRVRVFRPAAPGASIRRRGEDVRAGTTVLGPGDALGPGETGVLASLGFGYVTVARRPRVAVLSTGDELVDVGQPPEPGRIVNSNAYSLAALAREAGADACVLPIARDTLGTISDALASASDADVIVTSGGVSVGDFDFVRAALDALGAETSFWRVAMKPGKPLLVARKGTTIVLGLPGNPVSSFVTGWFFLLPLLRALGGAADPLPRPLVLPLAAAVPACGARLEFLRGRIAGNAVVPLSEQDSSALRSLAGADVLIERPAGAPAADAGTLVPVYCLDIG